MISNRMKTTVDADHLGAKSGLSQRFGQSLLVGALSRDCDTGIVSVACNVGLYMQVRNHILTHVFIKGQ